MAALLAGCVATNVSTSAGFNGVPKNSSLLLMPPDIKMYRVTASGISEPIAEWTDKARIEFQAALDQFTQAESIAVTRQDGSDLTDNAVEYDKLHAAVGQTILNNHYSPIKLPAKQGAFDWSLGDGMRSLTSDESHQFALFLHYRDYEAGGGRVGMAIFAAALGASIYTGHQGGFASLVDLRSGNIVWFNNVPLSQGNVRTAAGAQTLVKQLLSGLPAQVQD